MPTYEMFWDCESCGTTKLLGKSHRHCPSCGQVQDASWRYFPSEHEKVLVEDHVFHGVDWNCERCDTPNSAGATFCVNCGDVRDGVETQVQTKTSVAAGSPSGSRDPDDDPYAGHRDDLADDAVAKPTSRKRRMWMAGAVAALLAVLMVLAAVAVFWTKTTTAEVTGHSWERKIHIEQMSAVSGGSWCDSMPGDAYNVSQSRQQRGSNSIPNGESCSTVNVDNGDGTFSTQQSCHTTYREEPIYDDYCDYTVDRWQHHHTERSSGRGMERAPNWPSFSVTECGGLGCTRVGSRNAGYYVELLDADGTVKHCDFEQETWRSMPTASQWQGRKQVLLDNLLCSWLEPVETQ